jgi:hypothetical protein
MSQARLSPIEIVNNAVKNTSVRVVFTYFNSMNSLICVQFSLAGAKMPNTIDIFGKNSKIIINTAEIVHPFTLAKRLFIAKSILYHFRDNPLPKSLRKGSNFYFQPTSLKIMIAFALFSPRVVNGISCSLKSPHDLRSSEGSTFSFTGYS